ncbi:MAG: hypothetical protein E6J60_03480 [Deltaproteobacteria bacterium]|nr:MAG: hypothetical protein E6J60_03480 [Deltaproteobacteria bacterium]
MRYGVVLLAVGAAGCAFHDVSLRLPPSVGTGLSGGDSRQVVVVVPFADQRSQPNRCGMQKNSYNMETASAICSEPPAAWLANLLASELRAAGFSVVTQADRPSAVRVEGTLRGKGGLG